MKQSSGSACPRFHSAGLNSCLLLWQNHECPLLATPLHGSNEFLFNYKNAIVLYIWALAHACDDILLYLSTCPWQWYYFCLYDVLLSMSMMIVMLILSTCPCQWYLFLLSSALVHAYNATVGSLITYPCHWFLFMFIRALGHVIFFILLSALVHAYGAAFV